MSNLRTLPKGDSAWLLRRAIERIIQQVSVLETNIGSSTTGNSANTQVIFNDNGVLRGDVGLAYSNSTAALTIGGNVQAASATITGDLTVDTSTLKVDSANNRVGVLTASPTAPLDILGNSLADALLIRGNDNANCKIRMANSGAGGEEFSISVGYPGASNSSLVFRSITAAINRYAIDQTGAHIWATNAGTAMTLNSTGLGVGVVPQNNLHIKGASGTTSIRIEAITDGTLGFIAAASGVISGAPANNLAIRAENGLYLSGGGNATQFILNSSGNVGIGVTPSAWGSGFRYVQAGPGCAYGTNGSVDRTDVAANWYYNNGDKYINATGKASIFQQSGGAFFWLSTNTASGGAGSVMSLNTNMTLDASGNLLVGKTSASVTTVGFQTLANGEASTAMSSSTNAATTWNVYSTGAAAYRFYVGMGGTVYATNTTISAISDQRLKENVQDIDVGLGAILALKPRKFDWKAGKGKDIKGDRGFIAQEFEQVFPQLVDEWADPAPEGETPYKSVRQDLIPVLVKAIQELAAEVNALKNA